MAFAGLDAYLDTSDGITMDDSQQEEAQIVLDEISATDEQLSMSDKKQSTMEEEQLPAKEVDESLEIQQLDDIPAVINLNTKFNEVLQSSDGRRRSARVRKANSLKSNSTEEVPAKRTRRGVAVAAFAPVDQVASFGGGRRRGRGRRNGNIPTTSVVNSADSVIDLSSDLLPTRPMPSHIDLSDEDIDEVVPSTIELLDAETSFDAENYEISIKLQWEGELERIMYRKHQKFADLIKERAAKANKDPAEVVLMMDEHMIQPSDSPNSIGYSITKIITGRIVESLPGDNGLKKKKPKRDKNLITIKVQCENLKRPLMVEINKSETFRVAVIRCAEVLKCAPEKLRLRFDGDLVNLNSTPADEDFDGGEVLDVKITN